MSMDLNMNKNGFTIMEVIVSLGIITMGMLGVFSLVMQTTQVQTTNKNHLIGSMLAQEGIELIRQIKDENYLMGNSWNQHISSYDGTITIEYSGRPSISETPNAVSDAGARLYYDATTGFYTHEEIGNQISPFSRLITITNIDATSVFVSCVVRWRNPNGIKDYEAATELHDWY